MTQRREDPQRTQREIEVRVDEMFACRKPSANSTRKPATLRVLAPFSFAPFALLCALCVMSLPYRECALCVMSLQYRER
jgi:hypothetical protein